MATKVAPPCRESRAPLNGAQRPSLRPVERSPAVVSFDGIGTRWVIETEYEMSARLRMAVLARVENFDRSYSRFRPDSLVSRMAGAVAGGRFEFPDDATVLFDLYDRLAEVTSGAVDPLVGRQLELLGYDASYSLTPDEASRPEVWQQARPRWRFDVARDGRTLRTRQALVVDIGAAGKGYLVDLVCAVLEQGDVGSFLVDAGGDMRRTDRGAIRVGLEHPADPTRVIGVANLGQGALCASATNRRSWGPGLHHVLDARTGVPVRDVAATWVLAADAASADGLATALFVTDPDRLLAEFSFQYMRLLADGRLQASAGFDGELFA